MTAIVLNEVRRCRGEEKLDCRRWRMGVRSALWLFLDGARDLEGKICQRRQYERFASGRIFPPCPKQVFRHVAARNAGNELGNAFPVFGRRRWRTMERKALLFRTRASWIA
jgi:hypothetical protein